MDEIHKRQRKQKRKLDKLVTQFKELKERYLPIKPRKQYNARVPKK